jgi:hypothetical protein
MVVVAVVWPSEEGGEGVDAAWHGTRVEPLIIII